MNNKSDDTWLDEIFSKWRGNMILARSPSSANAADNQAKLAIQKGIERQNSIKDRALSWLLSDDTGVSSESLCAHMLGLSRGGYSCPPSDADDRGRCIRLLRLIPEWQDRLDEMTEDAWVKQVPLIRAELRKLQERK